MFEEIKQCEEMNDIIIYNSLIDLYISAGNFPSAKNVFTYIKKSEKLQIDNITFNTLIKGCCRNKYEREAFKYFSEMKRMNIHPTKITYNSLLDLTVKVKDMKRCFSLLEEMYTCKIIPDCYTYSIIMNGLKLNNSPARLVKNIIIQMKNIMELNYFDYDVVLFNNVFELCSMKKLKEEMDFFYEILKKKNLAFNSVTYSIIIKGYGNLDFEKAIEIFIYLKNSKKKMNKMIFTAFLEACMNNQKLEMGYKIFLKMNNEEVENSSIIHTTIIKGFMKIKKYNKAIEFFNSIKSKDKIEGQNITYNCALNAYIQL